METHHDGQVIRIFDLRHLVGNRVETVGAEDIVDTQRIEEAAESMRIARTALAESVVHSKDFTPNGIPFRLAIISFVYPKAR